SMDPDLPPADAQPPRKSIRITDRKDRDDHLLFNLERTTVTDRRSSADLLDLRHRRSERSGMLQIAGTDAVQADPQPHHVHLRLRKTADSRGIRDVFQGMET